MLCIHVIIAKISQDAPSTVSRMRREPLLLSDQSTVPANHAWGQPSPVLAIRAKAPWTLHQHIICQIIRFSDWFGGGRLLSWLVRSRCRWQCDVLLRFASFSQLGSGQEAMLQVRKPCSTIGLPFDEFESIDMSFHRSCAVGKCQSRQNCRFIPLDTASKGEQFSDARGTYVFEPGVKSLTAVVANKLQEAVGQLSCLRQESIHLRDLLQLLLSLRTQCLGTSQHPPDDLPWSHVLQG